MHQNRGMRCLLACLLILLSFNSAANDASHKLSEILAKIHNVKELLLRHQSEQVNLEKNLQKTELAINHVSQQLQKTLSDLSQKKRTISELTVNQHVLEDKIKEQQIILLKEIRLTYLLGLNKNKFQFILESKDPDKIHRLITYNHYLSLRNHHMITHLKNDLVNLNENKKTILLHVNHLADMQKDQTLQQKQLDSHKQNQKLVLNNLSLKVKSHQEQLDELLKKFGVCH